MKRMPNLKLTVKSIKFHLLETETMINYETHLTSEKKKQKIRPSKLEIWGSCSLKQTYWETLTKFQVDMYSVLLMRLLHTAYYILSELVLYPQHPAAIDHIKRK